MRWVGRKALHHAGGLSCTIMASVCQSLPGKGTVFTREVRQKIKLVLEGKWIGYSFEVCLTGAQEGQGDW